MIEELKQLIIEQIQSNEFLAGGLVLGLIGGIAMYLKNIPQQIWSRISRLITYTATVDQRNVLYFYLERWLSAKYSKSYRNVEIWAKQPNNNKEKVPPNSAFYVNDAEDDFLTKDKLTIKHKSDYFIVFRYGRILRIEKNQEKLDNARSFTTLLFNRYTISGFFAKNAINKLLNDVYESGKVFYKKENTVNIFTNILKDSWTIINDVTPKNLDNIVLKTGDKDNLMKDINRFISNKKWYTQRGILYKRGYLFYGSPGNGKTSLCLSISDYLKRDIYFLNLSNTSSSSLIWLFNSIDNNSILAIEDIDTFFNKRKGKTKTDFGILLNCLDGAFSKESIIVIFTTNNIKKLDDALIRDGRIDFKIKLDKPEKAEVEKYCNIFYNHNISLNGYQPKHNMASIQNICLRNLKNSDNAIKEILN